LLHETTLGYSSFADLAHDQTNFRLRQLAQAAIAALVQPISEAPKDGTWVLLFHKYAKVSQWYWDGDGWQDDENGNGLHWHEGETIADNGPTSFVPLSVFQKGKDDG